MFERSLDLTYFPKVIFAGKLPYIKEGGARAFIYASLEEQGEGEKGHGRGKGRERVVAEAVAEAEAEAEARAILW